MTTVERYREWFEHEVDCNDKMLTMIESVPDDKRSDAKFQRAIVLAAHLSACRENWLDRMVNDSKGQVDWWPEQAKLEELRPRFAAMQRIWSDYLNGLKEEDLEKNFVFPVGDQKYRWNIEGQIFQLVGHAYYHRGQVSQIVEELGGECVNTDYLFWAYPRNPEWGLVTDQ